MRENRGSIDGCTYAIRNTLGIFKLKDARYRHLQRIEEGIDINLDKKIHVGTSVMTVDMFTS